VHLILVDFDDTLVDTGPRFHQARLALFGLLRKEGFGEGEVLRVHHDEVDPEFLERMGYGPFRLEPCFRETYRRLCAHRGRRPDPGVMEAAGKLGAGVPGPPPAIQGALEALERLSAVLPTAIYTQSSDPDYQLHCIRGSGVTRIVPEERVVITPRKTPAAFVEVMARFQTPAAGRVCMVGNSIRSDVNPALAAGARAIHVEQEIVWVHDVEEPLAPDFPRVRSFPEAVRLLLG